MKALLIGIGILWVIGSVSVPLLESWELPGSNVVAASATAADEVSR